MKHYKVEVTLSESYVIDVKAKTQKQAEAEAMKAFRHLLKAGTTHYHMTDGYKVETGTVYDVTKTDDIFEPLN
jgi:cytosine/adenosine deaminase-related metal-dependent hydrolase